MFHNQTTFILKLVYFEGYRFFAELSPLYVGPIPVLFAQIYALSHRPTSLSVHLRLTIAREILIIAV